jgi:hypothetical protein
LEVKADYAHGSDRISPAQEAFAAMILSNNGIYLVADHIGWLNGKPDITSVLEKLKESIK